MNQYVRMLQPGYWLPIESLQRAAARFSKRVSERWDVPSGPTVAPDLKDVNGRFFRTADGHRISGLLLNSDLQRGFESPAWPLLFALLPPLTLVAVLLTTTLGLLGGALALIPILAILVLLAAIATSSGGWAGLGAFVGGVVLPVLGATGRAVAPVSMVRDSGFIFSSSMFSVAPVVGALVVLVGLGIFSEKKIRRDAAKLALGAGAVCGVSYVLGHLWPLANQLWWLGLACSMPWVFGHRTWRATMLKLAVQGQRATVESTGPMVFQHIEARQKQAENAARDTSVLIQLGVARGVFSKKMDGYAPDEGLMFAVSAKDLSTHFVGFGKTGAGKTSCVLRPIIAHYLGWREGSALQPPNGGLLVLDAKGELPLELMRLKGYTLIAPGHLVDGAPVQLGLIEGLSPNDLVLVFDSIGARSEGSESGNAKYFNGAARTMFRHIAVFVEALVLAGIKEHGFNSPDRKYRWTLHTIWDFGVRAQGTTDEQKQWLAGAVDYLKKNVEKARRVGQLADAITYLTLTLPSMDPEQRSIFWSTLEQKLDPILSNDDLLPWAHTERGFDVESVLRGGKVGVALNPLKYGLAGEAIQNLVRTRLFVGIRRRAGRDWRADGETPVMFAADEAQDLVGEADKNFLPLARSLGGECVYVSQSWEAFAARLGGETETNAFLANFRSFAGMASTAATGAWVQKMLGTTYSLVYQSQGGGVDFIGTARQSAEGPLGDDDHEGHRVYRSLVRRGAGSSGFAKSSMAQHDRGMDEGSLDLSANVITNAEWKLQPLLLDSEWDGYTAQPFVAVAEVFRAGVRRRDIIQCKPMFEWPAELLEETANHKPATEEV